VCTESGDACPTINNATNLWFLSFGSNDNYVNLSTELISELLDVYPKAKSKVYTVSDLPLRLRFYAEKFKRGYGYWHWKPFIVCDVIGRAQEGDVILYVDGRCGGPKGGSIPWLDKLLSGDLNGERPDLIAWRRPYVERHWSTGDLMERFGVAFDSEDGRSGQFAATFFALRVNKKTIEFTRAWRDFFLEFPELCRDEKSTIQNHETFLENRHDQSVFSLLIKNLSKRGLLVHELFDHDMSAECSIRPYAKKHPWTPKRNRLVRFINKIKKTEDILIMASYIFMPSNSCNNQLKKLHMQLYGKLRSEQNSIMRTR
jgi:hypothetical protein